MNLEQTISILRDLVAFPVLGGQSNLTIARYISDYLTAQGVVHHFVPNTAGDKKSIHCRIGPAVDGGLALSAHTDVVPVVGQDWHTDPFVLTQVGSKLYGRGSADMKGFLACCLAAVPYMQAARLTKPIYLAFSYDEEIGCLAGQELADTLMHFYPERPRYAIIGEPSLMQPITGHKGICVMTTTVLGSAGHSSRIKTEVSAVHEAAKLVVWLENKMNDLIAQGAHDARFQPPHSSIHVGQIAGGIAPNVIADKCKFFWDVRVLPGDSLEEILADYRRHCQQVESQLQTRFPGARILVEEDHPLVPPLSCPEDAAIVALAKKWSGYAHTATVAYAAEAGQFGLAGFEALICGPGDIAQAHKPNEFIEIDQLEHALRFIKNLVDDFS